MATRLKVGDQVQVIAGKETGKRGRVTKIFKDTDRVIVEGLNMVTRNNRPSAKNQSGGRVQKEASIHASNVMPIDPKTDKPTRVKSAKAEDGTRRRVGKSGAAIGAES